jgi:hypothetical protein
MLDFRPRRQAPASATRQGRRQIALLVLALGLVLVAMDHARKPEAWHWLWGGRPPADGGQGQPRAEAPVDTRIAALHPREGAAGTFRSPAPAPPPLGGLYPGVRPGYFASVEDDTVFRAAENDAWFHLFEVLSAAPPADLAAAATSIDFAQLFQQPAEYRGRLVTLAGRVRRVELLEAPANTYGVKRYYRAVLETSANPVFVYFLELPQGFPRGDRLFEDAAATGFFFKRMAYRAVDDIRTAPVIAARTLTWTPRSTATPPAPSSTWLSLLVLAAATYAGFWIWRLWHWRGRAAASLWVRRRPAQERPPLDPSFEVVDPREALESLAREHNDER